MRQNNESIETRQYLFSRVLCHEFVKHDSLLKAEVSNCGDTQNNHTTINEQIQSSKSWIFSKVT